MSGRKIIDGLAEAANTARLASEIAVIIQNGREEDASAMRTAYRILEHLGHCKLREPNPPEPRG